MNSRGEPEVRRKKSRVLGRRIWTRWCSVIGARRRQWLMAAGFLMVSVCLGRMSVIGESMPFGLGLYGAVLAYSPLWAYIALGGILLGVLSVRTLGDALLLAAGALAVRLGYVRRDRQTRYAQIPLLVGAASFAVGGVYQLCIGASLYGWLVAAASAVLSMLSAAVFLCGFRVFAQRGEGDALPVRQVQEGLLAMVVLLSFAVAGIGDVEWLGYGMQMAAGSLLALTLLYSAELGIALAGCTGLGFVIGIGDGNVSMTMAEYAMAGLAGGALKGFGRLGMAGGFMIGLVGMLVCFDPYGELWYRMAEALIGCGLFLTVPIRWLGELRSYLVDTAVGKRKEDRVSRVRDKLSAMVSLFLRIADSRQSCMAETADNQAQAAAILAAVEETACSVCEKRKDCWEEDFFAVSQEVLSLGDKSGAGEAFGRRCPSAKAIGESIERVIRREAESGYWRSQCAEQQSLLAKQMRSVGEILKRLEDELEPQKDIRRRQKEKIAKRLSVWGCRAEELTIGEAGESSRIELVCPSCGGKRICETRVLLFLQQVLGARLRMSVVCGAQNHLRRCRMFFVSQERLKLLTGMAGIAARSEEPSGDTCEITALSQGQTAIIVSDGMGCGSQASGDSQESVGLLRQLLEAGFSAETSVRTVNSLLLLRDDRERYATIDLLVIDKYTGEAEFVKLGAPPAFIKRQSEVLVVRDDTLPLGIVERPTVRPERVLLENGDFIVMVSDGILDIPESRLPSGHTKESWVRSQVRLFSGTSPQSLAEHLVEMALRLSGRTLHDDMTVVVIKIKTTSQV